MFCAKCGNCMAETDMFCDQCGTPIHGNSINTGQMTREPVQGAAMQNGPVQIVYVDRTPLTTLIQKENNTLIFWIVIVCLQVLIGLFYSWMTLIVAGINIFWCVSRGKRIKWLKGRPINICQVYKNELGYLVIALIYNFFKGGIIGVIAIVYSFFTRQYALKHENEIAAIENEFRNGR